MQVSGRRAIQRRIANQRRERGSRNKNRFFSFRLPLGPNPVRVHPQRPNKTYADFYDPDSHYMWKTGLKYFVKSKALNLPNGRYIESPGQECLITAYREPHRFGFNDIAPLPELRDSKPQDYFCISGWVEEWYEIVQKTRQNNDGTTAKWNARELAKGKGRRSNPRVYGHRFWVDFTRKQWEDVILPVYEEVERFTKDGGYLILIGYECEKCGKSLLDVFNNCPVCGKDEVALDIDLKRPSTSRHMAVCQNRRCQEEWPLLEYKNDELRETISVKKRCSKCDHEGYPSPVYEHTEGKDSWEAYDIYDVSLVLRKTGKGTQSQIHCDEWAIREPDARLFDSEYQGDGDAAEAIVKRHREPFDLDAIHSPDIAAVVADLMGVPNLFAGAGGTAHNTEHRTLSRNYRQEEEDDEEEYEEHDDEESEGGLFD